MVQCPQCNVRMREVTARANPGTLIQLDQCGKCGGIWCDKWELFPIDPEEVERLEAVNEPLLTAPLKLRQGTLYCPRCTAPLLFCKDPALPADLLLERYLRCEGIWLNRGQMRQYKRHQNKVQMEKMGAAAIIKKIPEVYDDPKSWVVKGTQGMMAYPRMIDDSEQHRASPGGVIANIIQILLRLALGV